MVSNLALSDSIERLKLTPLVASRLRYYGATTIEDLLQLSHQVPRSTNIADPALREIHALIDKVRKALVGVWIQVSLIVHQHLQTNLLLVRVGHKRQRVLL